MAIYDADEKHEIADFLFSNFSDLGITKPEQFTKLAEDKPTLADFIFQKHYKEFQIIIMTKKQKLKN